MRAGQESATRAGAIGTWAKATAGRAAGAMWRGTEAFRLPVRQVGPRRAGQRSKRRAYGLYRSLRNGYQRLERIVPAAAQAHRAHHDADHAVRLRKISPQPAGRVDVLGQQAEPVPRSEQSFEFLHRAVAFTEHRERLDPPERAHHERG